MNEWVISSRFNPVLVKHLASPVWHLQPFPCFEQSGTLAWSSPGDSSAPGILKGLGGPTEQLPEATAQYPPWLCCPLVPPFSPPAYGLGPWVLTCGFSGCKSGNTQESGQCTPHRAWIPAARKMFTSSQSFHGPSPQSLTSQQKGICWQVVELPRGLWERWVWKVLRTLSALGPSERLALDQGSRASWQLWSPFGVPSSAPPAPWGHPTLIQNHFLKCLLSVFPCPSLFCCCSLFILFLVFFPLNFI